MSERWEGQNCFDCRHQLGIESAAETWQGKPLCRSHGEVYRRQSAPSLISAGGTRASAGGRWDSDGGPNPFQTG